MELSIPSASIACMIFSLFCSFAVPIILVVVLYRRWHASMNAALYGLVVYFVVVFIIESSFNQFFMYYVPGVSDFLQSSALVFTLYVILVSGLFEETGRLAGMTLMKRANPGLGEALMFGAAFSGLEAFLGTGFTTVHNLIFAFNLNASGLTALLEGVPADQQADFTQVMHDMATLPAFSTFAMPGIERLMGMAFHMAMSVLIWLVVTKQISIGWFPAAIGMHAVLNIPASLYQYDLLKETSGPFSNIWLVESGTLLCTLFACVMSVAAYRRRSAAPPAALKRRL
jgi:uncharacterized membrane protein YhfC